jgi:hypothetical protein
MGLGRARNGGAIPPRFRMAPRGSEFSRQHNHIVNGPTMAALFESSLRVRFFLCGGIVNDIPFIGEYLKIVDTIYGCRTLYGATIAAEARRPLGAPKSTDHKSILIGCARHW